MTAGQGHHRQVLYLGILRRPSVPCPATANADGNRDERDAERQPGQRPPQTTAPEQRGEQAETNQRGQQQRPSPDPGKGAHAVHSAGAETIAPRAIPFSGSIR